MSDQEADVCTCERCYKPIEDPTEHGLNLCPLEKRQAWAVIGDDIPGGILVPHGTGMIHPDGSPKRYYSKTDIKRAANESGWTISGDTPKAYPVHWSGRKRTNAGRPANPNED